MAIQPETIAGRKEYFRKKRAEFVASWATDESGIVHIPCKNGMEILFSCRHFDLVSQFLWRPHQNVKSPGSWYAEATVIEELRHIYGRRTSLHRVVTGSPKGLEVDHENHNGMDCRDENLRPATNSQNASNRHYINSTGFRGVVRDKRCKTRPYKAQIDYCGKNHYLGMFSTATEAARAYNVEALRVFGEFAILNRFNEEKP